MTALPNLVQPLVGDEHDVDLSILLLIRATRRHTHREISDEYTVKDRPQQLEA